MDINIVAVVVAGIASVIVGSAWYSQVLFGKTWMHHAGVTQQKVSESKKAGTGTSYVAGLLTSIVMAYVLAWLIGLLGGGSIAGALYVAFVVWLGFSATRMLGSVIWEHKSIKLYFVNVFGSLVTLIAMALVLSMWQ